MRLPEESLLLSRWLRDPLGIGAVMPSGAGLARMMAAAVDRAVPGVVVELGGGTGAITTALLEAGIEGDRLIVLEREPELHRHLADRFPRLTVLEADASALGDCLRSRGIPVAAAVVSSLPMLSMPVPLQRAVLGQAFELLRHGGVFVQYTYGPGAPVAPARLAEWGLEARVIGRAWCNLPPASVWRLQRSDGAGLDQNATGPGAFLQQAAEACEGVLQRLAPRRVGVGDADGATRRRLGRLEGPHRQ